MGPNLFIFKSYFGIFWSELPYYGCKYFFGMEFYRSKKRGVVTRY